MLHRTPFPRITPRTAPLPQQLRFLDPPPLRHAHKRGPALVLVTTGLTQPHAQHGSDPQKLHPTSCPITGSSEASHCRPHNT